ncbi:hypothetical protein C7M52_00361 [Mixta theicola]|nr:hypothetical protein [Mixta theicola]QHM74431.1 hypothetical protein C7M52_00361 [Mixta theicola]
MPQTYLQLQMQAKKRFALALTRGMAQVNKNLISTINNVEMGGERVINYGSCLIPDEDYRNVCQNMGKEDYRLLLSVMEIYRREDVVLDMVQIYFQKTLKRIDTNNANKLVAFIQETFGLAAHTAANKTSKMALAATIAKLIVNSAEFKASHVARVNKFSSWFVTSLSYYGKAQLASLAVNKLKYQDSEYYHLLYEEGIEMLYFLIEPSMTKIIYQIRSGDNNPDVVSDALYEILKK